MDSVYAQPGYWVNFGSASQDTLRAVAQFAAYDTTLSAAWHIIGMVADSMQFEDVGQSPDSCLTSLFRWTGQYQQIQPQHWLFPGEGLYANSPGGCTLSFNPGAGKRLAAPAEQESPWTGAVVWAQDERGLRQQVRLGVDPGDVVAWPPPPPWDALDLRAFVDSLAVGQVPLSAEAGAEHRIRVRGRGAKVGLDLGLAPDFSWELAINGQRSDGSLLAAVDSADVIVVRQAVSGDALAQPWVAAGPENYPNPFNPETVISYQVAAPSRVELVIYNAAGQRVLRLVDEVQTPGHYRAVWNGRDAGGAEVANGLYFYDLRIGELRWTRKMLMVK